MNPATLLFDLDGTLTDPRSGITRCIRHALDRLSVESPSDDVLATFIGPPLRDTFASLLDTRETARIEHAVALYRDRFATDGLFENEIYDGVPAMLEEASHGGARMFVATSKPTIYAERIVEHFGLAGFFSRVYGAELGGVNEHKAELLAHLLTHEQVNASTAIMIGDRSVDVVAARANGVRSIGVLWGYGSETELRDAGADMLCANPDELLPALNW